MKKNRSKKNGFAMIIVLILLMLLLVIVYFYSEAVFTELAIARNNNGAAVAFSLAEAGVQEAIYKIQEDPTARNNFKTGDAPTNFSHDQALLSNRKGSYEVNIANSAPGVATITAIGRYKIGSLRTAKRQIEVGIAQGSQPRPYPHDSAIFAGGGSAESIADVDFWSAVVQIFKGSILSNRDINLKFGTHVVVEGIKPGETTNAVMLGRNLIDQGGSTLQCNCLVEDDGDPDTPQCSESPGCVPNTISHQDMPLIDFNSGPSSYKRKAQDSSQYFVSQKDFKNNISEGGTATYNGVVYIDDSLDIDKNRTVVINGVLATSGSINITDGKLMINRIGDLPAGGLTQKSFNVGVKGTLSGSDGIATGLIYAGDRVEIDSSHTSPINIVGGFITRRTWVSGYRVINITFNADVIDSTLSGTAITPVIEINHWEEEY